MSRRISFGTITEFLTAAALKRDSGAGDYTEPDRTILYDAVNTMNPLALCGRHVRVLALAMDNHSHLLYNWDRLLHRHLNMKRDTDVRIDRQLQADDLIVIAGAGGFIAGALARYFHNLGFTRIRAIDRKPLPEWYQRV